MNNELKKSIEELFDICAPNSSDSTVESISEEVERLRIEIINFISYLSASDGMISDYEADFIKEYVGVVLTAEELRKHIDKNNTYSTEFENTIPATLKSLLSAELQRLKERETSTSNSLAYLEVFTAIAKEFIVCDGEASQQEITDMSTYLNNLDSYLLSECPEIHNFKSSIDLSKVNAGEQVPTFDENGNKEKSLDDLISELNALIGLAVVKKDVNSLIHLQEIKRMRKQRGLKDIPVSNHLVFYGNPGTGKTTVARLLAQIYHSMGILSKGQFVEVDRSGLVAGYVGQTALKVQDVVKSALGGVLFIDEAYSLTYSSNGNDYGQEAVDTLLKAMEDNRDDFIVIVAGYPELMAQFIDSNPGLRSRFNKYINFEDYDVPELLQIFELMCKDSGYECSDEGLIHVKEVFETKFKNKGKNFANAREVRNYFESAVVNQADRIFSISNPTNQELLTLTIEDLP